MSDGSEFLFSLTKVNPKPAAGSEEGRIAESYVLAYNTEMACEEKNLHVVKPGSRL